MDMGDNKIVFGRQVKTEHNRRKQDKRLRNFKKT
jgi:hypothetical protein